MSRRCALCPFVIVRSEKQFSGSIHDRHRENQGRPDCTAAGTPSRGRAIEALKDAPGNVQRAFEKQLRFLAFNLLHPSLRAKKYDEVKDLWQARVNKGWRFYFTIVDDTYHVE
ncbi:MAG TPA: hypothetical protein VMS37_36050, partial [Verrucomicrobiae bacterium]|nr:hypothetical protein [Verrucomicrobiae bacterium]